MSGPVEMSPTKDGRRGRLRNGGSTPLTRRQFGTGAGALLASVMPMPSRATTVEGVPELSPRVVGALDPEYARLAKRLALIARKFARADAHYRACGRAREQWEILYRGLMESAEAVHGFAPGETDAERAVVAWSREIFPLEAQRARKPWKPIDGLSRRFQWLNAMFEAALRTQAVTRIPFARVTLHGFQNPSYPEDRAVADAYHMAALDVHRAADRALWKASPATAGDQLLRRRALEVFLGPPRVFELKYRRATRVGGRSIENRPLQNPVEISSKTINNVY